MTKTRARDNERSKPLETREPTVRPKMVKKPRGGTPPHGHFLVRVNTGGLYPSVPTQACGLVLMA